MAKSKKKWIPKKMKKGSFTKHCGGKVTDECIRKGLKSSNPTTRKRAALAKSFRTIARKRKSKRR